MHTAKQRWALIQGNLRRHVNAAHKGKVQAKHCVTCGRHILALRRLMVQAFAE